MSSGKFWLRVLTVAVGLPLFYALIFLLPHLHHLAFNLVAIAGAVLGALELAGLLRCRQRRFMRAAAGASGLIPAAAYLEVSRMLPSGSGLAVFIALILVVLLRSVWARRTEELPPILETVSSSLLVVTYPAVLMSFVVRLSGLPNASLGLFFFFCLIFSNDMMAYIAGNLARGWSRLGWAVSPNKSAVGFAAGMATSVGMAALFKALYPSLLPIGWAAVLAFGAVIGALTILGDLVESAMKRSAGVKDSSSVIPGRGGILDSVDSWLLAAPVFYLVLRIISEVH